jgi:hypothetical protein
MGRHDADPADRRRYATVAVLCAAVVALLVLGAFAVQALSHG